MVKTIGTGDKTDFDETRRLLYMALLAPRTKRYNLAGTLVNALRHHHGVADPGLERKIVDLVNGEADEDTAGREKWLQGQIDRITAELGG
jgi:hypothetical protein